MNRQLLLAFLLPTLLFHQSGTPILYSSQLLIDQVKEQCQITFDMAEGEHVLIIPNERKQRESTTFFEKKGKPSSTIGGEKRKKELPKTRITDSSAENREEPSFFENIEQKFADLSEELLVKGNESNEFAKMLASMSGTIFYGTKINDRNRNEYITF